jgi:eukaryotic-like serine/threonine-protein kinase
MGKRDQDSPPGFSDQGTTQPLGKKSANDSEPVDQTTPLPPQSSGSGSPVTGAKTGSESESSGAPPTKGSEPALPTFSPQEILAGRYRIIRFIGKGGMGDVYEADDLELRGRVALKTVRPAIAEIPGAMDRFKREIQLARKVTHPNVSRIFDIEHHPLPSGGDITFLTMELLRGETLAAHLLVKGRMTASESLPLISQMAAALTAAHQAGVVHRDFKTANVVLVPSDTEGGTPRAVVADFGLARDIAPEDSQLTAVSMPGEIMGTPAYMAPEQLKGEPVSAATDIYALGVVIYEMVTGTQPFVGDSPMATALKRLEENPTPPSRLVPGLDPQWERTILRCLERNPLNRFRTATEVMQGLAPTEVSLPAPPAGIHKNPWRLAAAFVAIIAVLASAFALHLYLDRRARTATKSVPGNATGSPIKARRSIAVLGFKNVTASQDAAWLSMALVEMLTTELSGHALRTVPGESVTRMKMDLGIADADSFSRETLGRIRANLGTDYVVMGSYTTLGNGASSPIRLDVRLQDAVKGDTIASVAETGTAAHLFDLVSKVGESLRQKLGAGEITKAEAGGVQSSLPSNPDAARLYSEGLSKLRVFEAVSARDLLQQAVAIEPDYSLAHSALAAAWADLGYDANAREQAKKAMDLSAGLSKEQGLLVQGGYRETTREWDKAIEAYQYLYILYPDNLEYGLRLARAQIVAGKGKDALATVKSLREMPAPARDDPRIDLAEASAAFSLSDFKGQQAIAAKAIQKGEERGARFVVAEGRKLEGMALWQLGQLKKASASFEEARQAYAAVGDRRGVADVLNDLAVLFQNQGNLMEAQKRYEVSMGECQDIGYQGGVGRALNNLANLLWIKGDLGGAKAMFDKALPIYNEIGDKTNMATVLDNNARVIMAQGNLAPAQKMFEQSLDIRREIGDQAGVVMSLNDLSNLYYFQGNLENAAKAAEEALRLSTQIANQSGMALSHLFMGQVLEAQDNLAGARKEQEHAASIWNQVGDKSNESDSRVALAKLQLEEGHGADGVDLLKAAIEEYQKEESADMEANAQALLARCLLVQGKTAEAQKAISPAQAFAQKSEEVTIRIPIAIADARVRAASGRTFEAIKILNATIAEATRAGIVAYQLEARAALGEVEIQYGNRARGHDVLASLALEATAKGFGLIARKAAASEKALAPNSPNQLNAAR